MPLSRDALGALIVSAVTVAVFAALLTTPAFVDWAFARHHNTLSWVVRPLLILPFCYAAWRHSLTGMALSVLAVLTSMFWFPAPATPDPKVIGFLAAEQEILAAGWSRQNILGALAVVLYTGGLAAAFWRRSIRIGFAVVVAGALGKILWSVVNSPDFGGSIVVFALGGVAVFGAALTIVARRKR